MIRTFFGKFLLVITLCSFSFSSQISTNLWTWENLGRPQDIKFLNENEFLLSTTRGTIAKAKMSGEIEWKKNMVYQTQFEIANTEEYSLLINQQSTYLDLINNKNSQLIWSINFNRMEEGDFVRWDLLTLGKNFIGVLATTYNVKIFNNEKVIAEIEAQPNEKNLDFVIDPFLRNLYVAVLNNDQTVRVDEINLNKFTTIIINKILTRKLEAPIKVKKAFLTIKFVFMVMENGLDYLQINLSNNMPLTGKLPATGNFELDFDLEKLNIADKMVLYSLKGKDKTIQLNNLQKNKWTPFTVEKDKDEETYNWNVVENEKETTLYLIRKKNANTLITYNVNLREDICTPKQLNTYTIKSDNAHFRSFYVNPKRRDNFILVSREDKMFLFEKTRKEPVVIDQALANVSFIELVGYYSDQGKMGDKVNYHNNLDSILNQKEITNIFSNIFHMLLNDISDIYTRIKNNLINLFNKKATITTSSNLFKHYLILFTEGSQELYILNAIEGNVILNRKFDNKRMDKMIRNTEEDINMGDNKFVFLVLKDDFQSTFSVLKFNLETAEINEDSTLIDELKFEEEVYLKSHYLVKNPKESPLTMKVPKALAGKFDNKFLAEFEDNNIYGIKFKKSEDKVLLNLAWNYILTQGYMIVDRKSPNIHSNLSGMYHVMGKVFYKYIDSNMILILSQMENKTLMVTLIKANTGKVLHQSYISNVDFTQKIISVFEENLVVVSYVKKEKGFSRSEIYSIEMMKREIEHSFVHMIEKNIKEEGENKSENVYENDLVFLTQTYVLTRRVKNIFVSKSKLNIANKYLIFLMENNQVFLLDKRGLSPRRPLVKEDKGKSAPPVLDPLNSPYVDPEMTPYNPVINFDHKNTLNINFLQDQIDNILISPTQFESTFILCTEGLNLSCYKVYPDKTFDTLSSSFAYPLIATFVVGIITLAYMLRRYVKKNEFRQTFLNN